MKFKKTCYLFIAVLLIQAGAWAVRERGDFEGKNFEAEISRGRQGQELNKFKKRNLGQRLTGTSKLKTLKPTGIGRKLDKTTADKPFGLPARGTNIRARARLGDVKAEAAGIVGARAFDKAMTDRPFGLRKRGPDIDEIKTKPVDIKRPIVPEVGVKPDVIKRRPGIQKVDVKSKAADVEPEKHKVRPGKISRNDLTQWKNQFRSKIRSKYQKVPKGQIQKLTQVARQHKISPLKSRFHKHKREFKIQRHFLSKRRFRGRHWMWWWRHNPGLFLVLFPVYFYSAYGYYPPIYYDFYQVYGYYPIDECFRSCNRECIRRCLNETGYSLSACQELCANTCLEECYQGISLNF